jgi:hypothetical protein
MVMIPTLAAIPELTPAQLRLMLLMVGLLLSGIFMVMLLLAVRRSTIHHAAGNRHADGKQPSPPVDAWIEAGRRLQVEPGVNRLDDTVDLDPFEDG